MPGEHHDSVRALPSITRLLEHEEVQRWLLEHPRAMVVTALRAATERARRQLLSRQQRSAVSADEIVGLAGQQLRTALAPSLREVINATGVVLHTGLGRAPLARRVAAAISRVAQGYCNLELDLTSGRRGHRHDHVAGLLCELTGARAATVVNNNAAATLLVLNTLSEGREVIVSRGQLIEIGGSYRLPDVMTKSGAILRPVGTTNRTRITDYANAINDRTGLLLHVHTSNYRILGFSESVEIEPLAALAHERGLPVFDDLGSGAMFDLTTVGLPAEPNVPRSIRAGADVISFSGDKLLGGPQSGIILGSEQIIQELNNSPLMRTFRVDKLTLAGLEATLHMYRDPQQAAKEAPALAMLTTPLATLTDRARRLAEALRKAAPDEVFDVSDDVSFAGGGSLPAEPFPTRIVMWRPRRTAPDRVLSRLRAASRPVVARLRHDAVLFDARTVQDREIEQLASAVAQAAAESPPPDDKTAGPLDRSSFFAPPDGGILAQ